MAHNMKKFKGREKIALAAVPPGVPVPRSITLPRFYEVVMITNPVILTDADEFNRNFNRNDPFFRIETLLGKICIAIICILLLKIIFLWY